jgi:hypothetical protein
MVKKEHQLEDVYKNLEVECVVSNLRGTQTDYLDIKDYIVSLFLSNESTYQGVKDEIPFSSYIKNLKLKLTLKYELLDEEQEPFIPNIANAHNIIGLTYPSVDSFIAPDGNVYITYFEHYTEALFQSEEPVCIVSAELYQTLPKDEEGNCELRIAVGSSAHSDEIFAEQRLKVGGTYEGQGSNIYCPWKIIQSLSVHVTRMISAESLSFSVKDNKQLDTFKELLARYFTAVDNTGALKEFTASDVLHYYEYAITVYDGTLNETVSKLRDNIKVLEILQPVIIMISFLLGFLASFLFVKNRKQEFAIMRSLGTKKGMVFGEAFFEQFILGFLGTALGLMAFYIRDQFESIPPWGNIAAFLLCYMIGSSLVVYRIVNVKVMAILKEKE